MGINYNKETKAPATAAITNEKAEKKISITHLNVTAKEDVFNPRPSSTYSQKSSLGVYSIYGGFPVESRLSKDLARRSIISIKSEKHKLDVEQWYHILLQVGVPFFIAGIGTIGAGIVLSRVENYRVFKDISALYVLIPALLGLKGNLDMCLASRLSTQSNLGKFNNRRDIIKIVSGNVLLVQIQSIVASCVVSVFAVSVSALINGNFQWIHTLLLATASTMTATMSCFILDLVLVAIIIGSYKLKLNPDNIATPMAASIGDVVSLFTLSMWARLLYNMHDEYPWLIGTILACYIVILLPIWIFLVWKNEYTKDILAHGWVPVLSALLISGCGGLVLDMAVDNYRGYSVFQPIINGIGGNLVSVQASRISTMLHKTSFRGVIPSHTRQWVSPFTALIHGVLPAKSARILLSISVPGHLVFMLAADAIFSQGVISVKFSFVAVYVAVGLIQIIILLYICHLMVHTMWRFQMDPDNSSIPYLTALGDLLGSTLLLSGFIFLEWIGEPYRRQMKNNVRSPLPSLHSNIPPLPKSYLNYTTVSS